MTDIITTAAEELDDETFCPRCLAGTESSEHVEKCVRMGYGEWGEAAPESAPEWAGWNADRTAERTPDQPAVEHLLADRLAGGESRG
jgi:ribosomal protein S27AE